MLAEKLKKYQGPKTVVYALPRGGVVLAAEIARKLNTPPDLISIRKIGHPENPEYALCATSENSRIVCNEKDLKEVDKEWFKKELEKGIQEAKRRRKVYLQGKNPISAQGKIAIIVDDGIATGLTMQAAIKEIKDQYPQKIIVAVPVVPKDTAEKIKQEVDELVALEIPEFFQGSVGAYYQSFPQITDQEVIELMNRA